jgi:hypothetical protein
MIELSGLGWSWLEAGGLNGRLVTISYAYASRYMRTCPDSVGEFRGEESRQIQLTSG